MALLCALLSFFDTNDLRKRERERERGKGTSSVGVIDRLSGEGREMGSTESMEDDAGWVGAKEGREAAGLAHL